MDVFISWSGDRSKYVAQCLQVWFKQVLQMVKPWLSSEDILAGARWNPEIAQHLSPTSFGVVCVTPENLTAPWLMFEAGALAKTIDDKTFVCPYLIGLDDIDPRHPLSQFQCKRTTKDGTYDVVHSMHLALCKNNKDIDLTEPQVKETFEQWWPRLEAQLQKVPAPSTGKEEEQPDATGEILTLVRGIAQSVSAVQAQVAQSYDITSGAIVPSVGGRAFFTGGHGWARIPTPPFFGGSAGAGTAPQSAGSKGSEIILVCPKCGTSENTSLKKIVERSADEARHLTVFCSHCAFEFGLHVSQEGGTVQACPESCPFHRSGQ